MGLVCCMYALCLFNSSSLYGCDTPFNTPGTAEHFDLKFDYVDMGCAAIGCAFGAWYIMTKHWIANNIFGLAFSVSGISMLSVNSFSIGAILLAGLFVYDIFWVFGTEVMVTVAKSFDAPIKGRLCLSA